MRGSRRGDRAAVNRASVDWAAVAVIAVGGGVGSVARYELAQGLHPPADGFPTATLITNLFGSLLLGALVVAVSEVWSAHRLVRPLFGTGLLGGFTTFSTFAVQTRGLAAGWATAYVAASVLGGLLAAAAGMYTVRRGTAARRRARVGADDSTAAIDPLDPDLP